MSCNKKILSVVNKLNGRVLKIEDSYGVTSGDGGKEVSVKFEGNSDCKED